MVGGSIFDRLRRALVEGTFFQNSFQFINICKQEKTIVWRWDNKTEWSKLNCAFLLTSVIYQMCVILGLTFFQNSFLPTSRLLLPFIDWTFHARARLATISQNSAFCLTDFRWPICRCLSRL